MISHNLRTYRHRSNLHGNQNETHTPNNQPKVSSSDILLHQFQQRKMIVDPPCLSQQGSQAIPDAYRAAQPWRNEVGACMASGDHFTQQGEPGAPWEPSGTFQRRT